MKKDDDGAGGTFNTVRDRYDRWDETRPEPVYRGPPQAVRNEDSGMARLVTGAVGMGIGALLLLLSLYSFWVSLQWAGVARGGAAVGYGLVGFFLLIAGLGGLLGTYNHNFRVFSRPPAAPH